MFVTLMLLLVGFIAGFTNGLLGTGGGIILVFALKYLYKDKELKDVFATTLTVILALSAVSVIVYLRKNNMPANECIRFLIPATAGGFLGACLLERIDVKWLKKVFGLLIIIAGLNMIGLFG